MTIDRGHVTNEYSSVNAVNSPIKHQSRINNTFSLISGSLNYNLIEYDANTNSNT